MDTNVENYTIPELVTILGLADTSTKGGDFRQACDFYIQKFNQDGNARMSLFFKDIKRKLLDYITTTADNQEPTIQDQTKDWVQKEVLDPVNPVEKNKTTDRQHTTVDVYQNDHNSMNKKQLGVSNTHDVPIIQDVLNPNLKNVTERFLNIDSQYRQTGSSTTNFTMDLSDQLNDTLSMRLFSFQIPVTWYVIDQAYSNNSFWITDGSANILIAIESGNYTPASLVTALNASIQSAGFTFPDPSFHPVTYNEATGKINIQILGAVYNTPPIHFTVTTYSQLTFFNPQSNLSNNYINQTLGWVMGYQLPFIQVAATGGNQATAVLDLNGTRYLILVLDDFNQNRINNGLVGITEMSNRLKLPSYYSPDLPIVSIAANTSGTNFQSNIQDLTPEQSGNNNSPGELLMEKANITYRPYPQLVPSSPRVLTQSQMYTINQIIKNNNNTTNYRTKAPTNTDVFAMIPVKGGLTFGSMFMEISGSLQSFRRTYFGPVNVDRLQATLLDDKGNILNLNGCDWSILMIVENLYQY